MFSFFTERTGSESSFMALRGRCGTREELLNVGQDNVPKGKTWYWVGANQPGRDLVRLEKPPDAAAAAKGAGRYFGRTWARHPHVGRRAGAGHAHWRPAVDLRRGHGAPVGRAGASRSSSASRESNGGTAAHAQIIGKFGGVYVNAEALIANDFHLRGGDVAQSRETGPYRARRAAQARQDRSFRRMPKPITIHNTDGSATLDAAGRLSASVDRFNLGTALNYHRDYVAARAGAAGGELWVSLLGSGHIGQVRVRTDTEFDVLPGTPVQERRAVSLLDRHRACRLGRPGSSTMACSIARERA